MKLAQRGCSSSSLRDDQTVRTRALRNRSDPAAIQQHADSEIPIDKVLSSWAVGTDPAVHVKKVQELFDSGVTIVNIHTGQADQKKLLDFYRVNVLPKFT